MLFSTNLGQNSCRIFHLLAQFPSPQVKQNYDLSPESECTMLGFDSKYSADHPKAKFWRFGLNLTEISCKIFHRKIYFAYIRQFVYNLFSKTDYQKASRSHVWVWQKRRITHNAHFLNINIWHRCIKNKYSLVFWYQEISNDLLGLL